MHIQSYQIHNVLNVYRRQLSQPQQTTTGHPEPTCDPVNISSETKSHAIMEKVAASVLERITNVEPGSDFATEMRSQRPTSESVRTAAQEGKQFTFTTIVGSNQKETRAIDIDSSHVLMRRLDELAKAAIDHTSEDSA